MLFYMYLFISVIAVDCIFSINLFLEKKKNYLKIRGLKVTGTKKELVAWVLAASENGFHPIKTAVKIESVLITEKQT